jgi:Na+-driven multidrug efflux pump
VLWALLVGLNLERTLCKITTPHARRHGQSFYFSLAHDFRLTLCLALPLILAEVGWMSMGVVDTIMVGRLPDSVIAIGATGVR